MTTPLLAIENLVLGLPQGADRSRAVDGISLTVDRNEIVCLVGESGSGKSMTAHAILGLLPSKVEALQGEIRLGGRNLIGLAPRDMRALRGSSIAMIFQEPLTALNPLAKVGHQVAEAISIHGRIADRDVSARVTELFDQVGLPDPASIGAAYPAAPTRDDRYGAR